LAPESIVTAYDIQAACSGYLYALANAWDFLQAHRGSYALVLTTETMRRIVDIDDPNTSPIFGDAATASVLSTDVSGMARLCRPVLGAFGEVGSTLQVPLPRDGGYVRMDGRRIFPEAIRRMRDALEFACRASNVTIAELDLIVPHQANGRIIEALRIRLQVPAEKMWNEIRFHGNTSSSSIPLALDTALRVQPGVRRIGLCTFGAGYTFGGALLLPQ
jgi:2-oxoisovalerate dehydrogenase E1 component